MVGRRVWSAALCAGVSCVIVGVAGGSSGSGWKVTDLGTVPQYRSLSYAENRPVAINTGEEIVASSSFALYDGPLPGGVVPPDHAFAWQRGKLSDLGKFDPTAINDRGEIVGSGLGAAGHALLWRQGKLTDLGTLGGRSSEAVGINRRGQVVGTSDLPGSTQRSLRRHAFLWQDGKMTDLGTLGGRNSRAIAINDHGQVIGVSDTAAPGRHHGFLWQNGKMTDLGTLGGWTSNPVAINERGQVIGQSTTAKGTAHAFVGQAFLWQDGKMIDLGLLPSHPICRHKLAVICENMGSEATAINDRGQIVGSSVNAADNKHAFLWQNGKMADLGTLGGIYSTATSINDRGQIVGASVTTTNSFVGEAFLWQNGKMIDLGPGGAIAINQAGTAIIGSRTVGTSHPDGSFSSYLGSRALLWSRR